MVKYKCKQCKEIIDSKVAFKVPISEKRSSYFCNENEYLEYIKVQNKILEEKRLLQLEKDKFNELDIYIAVEILGNELGQIVPPLLKRKVKDLRKHYSYEVIRLCFEYLKKDLNYYLGSKEFEDEQHKINYIMVVVNSTINDTYRIWKRQQELQRISNKMLETQQESIEEITKLSNKSYTKKSNDISAFLSEEDL